MPFKYQEFDNRSGFRIPFTPLRIQSEPRAIQLTEREPGKWNIVSLWANYGGMMWDKLTQKFVADAHDTAAPKFPNAKSVCQQEFHDIDKPTKGGILCTEEHLRQILAYAKNHLNEPLLIHCRAGISRSTAVAFLILLDNIKLKSEWPAEDAISIVHNIRPIAQPNRHIINIGVPLVANGEKEEVRFFRELYNSDTFKKIYG